MKLNLNKCQIRKKQSLIYLGFKVGGGKLEIDLEKVRVIKKSWPRTKTVTKVRNFMGVPECQKIH